MRRLLRAVALLSLTLGASPFAAAQVAPTSQPGPLIGVWASETTFGPALRGELSVVRGDSVRFAFPGGFGEFRGMLGDKGRAITGFWIQPGSVVLGYPFALPLALRVADPGVWRGTVVPLDDRFSLYLVVWKKDDGTLVGAFRNPELNSRGGASSWVTRSTSPQMVISEATTGLDSTRFAESYNKAVDGYVWHLSMLESG